MASNQITRWVKLTSVLAIIAVINGVRFQSAIAQPNQPKTDNQACQIIRHRLKNFGTK